MATTYATHGFVFKKEDRLEADRVFSLFTHDFGRLEVTGKAIRKIASKLGAGIELFSFCDIEFIEGRHAKTLTDAVKVKKFPQVTEDPECLTIASRIAALMQECIRGQEKDVEILNLIENTFEKLNSDGKSNSLQLTYQYFFWNFISLLGYTPQLSVCTKCHGLLNPANLYLSGKEGGVVCQNCKTAQDQAIGADAVKIVRLILQKDWRVLLRVNMSVQVQEFLETATNHYYEYVKH